MLSRNARGASRGFCEIFRNRSRDWRRDGANKQLAEDDADCAAAQDEAMDKIRAEQGRRMIEACRANPNDPRYYCQNVLK